jgi:hypothetical protein
VTKKDREESLLSYIQDIVSQLPLMDFYQNIFPTNPMKICVARIYVQIMSLLDEALAYYRGGKLSTSPFLYPKHIRCSNFSLYL